MDHETMRRPWSEIGIDISDQLSVKQALIDAGLDFRVEVVPGYFNKGKNIATGYNYIVRTDVPRVLGQCKGRFKPLQNDVLVEIAQPLIDKGQAKLDTIGTFGTGEKIWILLRLNDYRIVIDKVKGDGIDHYLLLLNGHDGSTSIQVGIIPFRLWCANQLPRVGESMIKFRHTENAAEMLQFFNQSINKRLERVNDLVSLYQKMVETKVNSAEAELYFRKVMKFGTGELPTRSVNIINQLKDLNKGDTYWHAFNAITEYLNYLAGRGQSSRLNSLWFGANNLTAQRALSLAG